MEYWHTELSEAAARGKERPSFHTFAEGQLADVRGRIFNLKPGETLDLWTEKWPSHLFIVIALGGETIATLPSGTLTLRMLSQLVVLPGTRCRLIAAKTASLEIIAFLAKTSDERRGNAA